MIAHHANPNVERSFENAGEEEMVSLLGKSNGTSDWAHGQTSAGTSEGSMHPAPDSNNYEIDYETEGEEEDHLGTIDWSYERVRSRVHSSTLRSSMESWSLPLR